MQQHASFRLWPCSRMHYISCSLDVQVYFFFYYMLDADAHHCSAQSADRKKKKLDSNVDFTFH